MSPVGSIMWAVGQDASLRMVVGNLMILDRAPSKEAIADRVDVAAAGAPRLRQRPTAVSGIMSRPVWANEVTFSAREHIRVMAVPSPGDLRQVLDLVTLLELAPFDGNLSPWDLTIIEGVEGGRAAIFLRAHHSLTDGLHGVSLLRRFIDEPERERKATTQPAPVTVGDFPLAPDVVDDPLLEWELAHRRRPGTVNITIDVAGAVAGAVRPIANGVVAAMRADPVDAVVRRVQHSLDVVDSVSRQVVVTGGRLSQLSPSRSMNSRFEAFSVDGARTAALALGGSRNDLLVAGAAVGLGAYHEKLGIPCTELRLALPARWRHATDGGGSVVPVRVEIPAANQHPGPLFGVVAERLNRARHEPALRVTELLTSAVSRLPTRFLASTMRAQANTVDFVATSLPGIRGVRHFGGAVIEKSFPFGPRLGSLVNITGYGVDDRLDVGVALDPSAIAEPELLIECMLKAFEGFVAAHGT
jgi:WS/DGAT/MGAT family acyltransferase